MALRSESVVGMHLHRQIVGRVYKLHQQGKLASETVIQAFAHYIGSVSGDGGRECFALEASLRYY